jgi:hypothetical protein
MLDELTQPLGPVKRAEQFARKRAIYAMRQVHLIVVGLAATMSAALFRRPNH